jgi:hypothetical protein
MEFYIFFFYRIYVRIADDQFIYEFIDRIY